MKLVKSANNGESFVVELSKREVQILISVMNECIYGPYSFSKEEWAAVMTFPFPDCEVMLEDIANLIPEPETLDALPEVHPPRSE